MMTVFAGQLLFVGVLLVVLIAILRYFFATIKLSKSSKRKLKTQKQELFELLEAHSAASKGKEKKPKVGYAVLAESDDPLETLVNASEGTSVGKQIGNFVFFTTAAPLILTGVLLVIDLIWLLVHLINGYTFQLSSIPWPSGIGFLSFIALFIPVSIFAGMAMLPFGYRSQFRIGRCESILAIVTFVCSGLATAGMLFATPFESTVHVALALYSTYVSSWAFFGVMYYLCSLLGLCTTGVNERKPRPNVQFGNWPRIEDEPES